MGEPRKKLLFIGNAFHRKTGSSAFVQELLADEYEIERCFVDLFSPRRWDALDEVRERRVDVLVCWQVMPPVIELVRRFSFRHAVLFPMYDACPDTRKPEKWYPFRSFQIISFSRTLHRKLSAIGLSSRYIQYFPPPQCEGPPGDESSVFFWNRGRGIDVSLVEALFRGTSVRHIHLHCAADPGRTIEMPKEDSPFSYTFTNWFEDREELKKTMRRSAFYIAPRRKEGIGMSFLEAMAMGRCVVAPDSPTMNEYIVHGKTGLLYDPDRPKRLEIPDVRAVQSAVCAFMEEGYRRWEREKVRIVEWCEEPGGYSPVKLAAAMVVRFFRNPVKVLRALAEDRKARSLRADRKREKGESG